MKVMTSLQSLIFISIICYAGTKTLRSTPFISHEKRLVKETDTISAKALTQVDLNKYVGKTVSTLLADPVFSKYKECVFIDGKPGSLLFVSFEYSSRLSVYIFVKKFKYTKQFDINEGWKLDTFKKEVISEIRIKLGRRIIKDTNKLNERLQPGDPFG